MLSRRAGTRAALAAVALACALAGCTGDDDGPPASTELPPVADVQPTIETVPSNDPDFLPSVLADDVVTADELATAYERFVQCLAEGGAHGIYAYDIELHATLALEYQVDGDDSLGNYSASLRAGCSRDFLDRLSDRYYNANPDPDDLGRRQRESVVDCVRAVDPAAVPNVPDEVTTDSAAPGFYLNSGTLDLSFLTNDEAALPDLQRCFYSVGAEWRPFGTSPPSSTTG